jgi:phosphate transport system protein
MFREYLTYMLEDPKHLSKFVHLQFVAKQIERMGDHSTTIAEQAIFKSSGIDLSSLSRSKVDYLDE